MKFKTTRKEICSNFPTIISVPYCSLQSLLHWESPIAYTTRREGWAADIYEFGDTAIVTGYAPFGNILPGYSLCQKYENAAEKIRCGYGLTEAKRKEQLRELIKAFIKEVTQ